MHQDIVPQDEPRYRYARSRRDGTPADVSRSGNFRALSPFAVYPGRIPIPGRMSYIFRWHWAQGDDWLDGTADSVEGVWQGLKCLERGTEERLFRGQPKKRRGRTQGHLFADYRFLDDGQARSLIYIPAYLELLRQQSEVIARLDPTVDIVDVRYQPEPLGPKPLSHAALLVDYLNGALQPYEESHLRLLNLAERMHQRYLQAASDSDQSPVADELIEIGERVKALGFPSTESYATCARLFERENLILMATSVAGCPEEVLPMTTLFRQWRCDGLLTREQARALAASTPMSRLGNWWAEE